MCGILMVYGSGSESYTKELIHSLKHRGPDDIGYYNLGNLSIAFTRLAINDKGTTGAQPHETKQFISVTNGEIYNYQELCNQYKLLFTGNSDTHVVAPLFEIFRDQIIEKLDGFYSGLIFEKNTDRLFSIKDYIGKKGLFLVKSGGFTIITSELKTITRIDNFQQLPKGVCEIDLENSSFQLLREHKEVRISTTASLKDLVIDAVKKRILPSNETFGVFLSGGLDSSIVAAIANKFSNNVIYYILAGDINSEDYIFASKLIRYLHLKNIKFVKLPNIEGLEKLISKVVFATESYNPSIISNGICTYLLSKEAKLDGLKVILSGEGADELFCGYHNFDNCDDDWKLIRQNLINDMCFTELRRIDLACMSNSIEARCPFLDRKIYSYSQTLSFHDFYQVKSNISLNKYILRKAFEEMIPKEICYRPKTSFDVGSGLRKIIVDLLKRNGKSEKEELFSIWKNLFPTKPKDPYFHSYPVFDDVIAQRGKVHKS